MTREEKEKIIAECEHMSFDFELFGRPTKALCLDAIKNILNNIPETEYISDDNSESESEIESTSKNDIPENPPCIACKYDDDDDEAERCERCGAGYSQFELDDALFDEFKEPTTKNDLVVDCIKKSDAIQTILNAHLWNGNEEQLIEDIKELPSVTPQEPRKGHWYIKDKLWWACSACGCQTRMMKKYNVPNFCPACGADMREESENKE